MEKQPEDKLNRKDEAKFLINYLTKRYETKDKDSFVLNVNAKWGYGKTYFLKLLEEELVAKKHEVIYFDAWANDFTKEPLLAFFSEINDSLGKYLDTYGEKENESWKTFKKSSLPILGAVLTKQLTGLGIDKLDEYLDDKEDFISEDSTEDTSKALSSIISKATQIALKEHSTLKNSIKDFKTNMSKILDLIEVHNKKLPLFILVDELDRCRPNYAIELLENIKHIFDIKGIYFIIATNSKQLSYSINAIYGQNFSSETYLKRFFHQEYNLKEPDRYEFIKFLFEKEISNAKILFSPIDGNYYDNKDTNIVLFERFSLFFNLGLRDIEQSINTLSAIVLTWDSKNEIHLAYILFFIMANQKNKEYFDLNKKSYLITEKHNFFKKKIINLEYNNIKGIDRGYSIEDLISLYMTIKYTGNSLPTNTTNRNFHIILNNFFDKKEKRTELQSYPNLVLSAAQLK